MESLQFTFNSKQLSQDINTISYKHQPQLTNLSSAKKKQIHLPSFRSKKLRRYEEYIQNVNLEDYQFIPPTCQYKKNMAHLNLDENNQNIKPRSSNRIETSLRPKVSTRSKKFPTDFNMRSGQKPKSLQLIRQQIQKTEQCSFKKQIIQQILSRKRSITSKDAPKIHFPNNHKILPSVFKMRSISHQKFDHVNSTNKKENKQMTSIDCQEVQQTPIKRQKKRQIYLQLAKKTEDICNSQPNKSLRRHKKIEFCLNAEQTPRFQHKKS